MFLTKKNANYFNKPKNIDPTKPKRVLGGWEDDTKQADDQIDYTKKQQSKNIFMQPQNLLQGQQFKDMTELLPQKNDKKQGKQKYYLDWDQLDAKNDIQCEKKIIQQIVQPGGIRIKPSDSQLLEFFKQTKGMDVHIIGSLLLSKIQVNYPFQIKAKALYTIQYIVKKNEKFAAYFKAHSQKLKTFPEPQDNVDNYKKILKSTLNTIGINSQTQIQIQPQLTYVDPGYNDQPNKKSSMKQMIENSKKQKKSEVKRAIIGPGQQKKGPSSNLNNDDILGLDLLGNNGKSSENQKFNLLEGNISQNNSKNISFDQLFGQNSNKGSPHDLI